MKQQQSFYKRSVELENTQVLDKKISYDHKEVRVVLIGPEVPDASISIARSKLKEYKLEDTKLIVLQGMNNEAVDVSSIRAWSWKTSIKTVSNGFNNRR